MRNFSRRPGYRVPQTGWSDQLTCEPRSYIRAHQADYRPLYAPCFAWAPGPQTLASTGDGSYPTLFGSNWLVEICRAGDWILYQRTASDTITDTPWDVAPPTATARARKPSLAFDQSARPAIAWEDDDGIHLRQFDEIAGVYAFTGPYVGVDPVLINDATVNYHIPGSDVILFYLSTDRLTLNYRIQSENFDTEHAVHTFAAESIIDLSDNGGFRFQVRYSDGQGSIPGAQSDFVSLLSDIYPIYVGDAGAADVGALTDGAFAYVGILRTPAPEPGAASVGSLGDGVYTDVIILRTPNAEPATINVGALQDGVYLDVIILRIPNAEPAVGSLASLRDGTYVLAVIDRTPAAEPTVAGVGSLTDGAYA